MNTNWIIRSERDVPGYITYEQCDKIKELAASLEAGAKVLEIGVCWGRSTWSWLSALPENSSLISIDPFILNKREKLVKRQRKQWNNKTINEIMQYFLINGFQDSWQKIIQLHPRSNISKKLYVGTSENFINENLDETFDVVYLDGDHKYETVSYELRHFENNSKIICGDDYHPSQSGVVKAIDEMIIRTGRIFWKDPNSRFWTATYEL